MEKSLLLVPDSVRFNVLFGGVHLHSTRSPSPLTRTGIGQFFSLGIGLTRLFCAGCVEIKCLLFDLIQQLGHAIKARGRLLMLLDNAEQVQKEVAQVVSTWRTSVPDVRFLVTSRVPLGLPGEQVRVLEPLGLPSSQHFEVVQRSEAVTLFVERAMEVQPGFALSRENMDDVRTVVCQLDGMQIEMG